MEYQIWKWLHILSSTLLFGTGLAMLRVQLAELRTRRQFGVAPLAWLLTAVTRVFVEWFRGAPVVITIFFVFCL